MINYNNKKILLKYYFKLYLHKIANKSYKIIYNLSLFYLTLVTIIIIFTDLYIHTIRPTIGVVNHKKKQLKNISQLNFWNLLQFQTKILIIFLIIIIIANIIINAHYNIDKYKNINNNIKDLVKSNLVHKNHNLYHNFNINHKIKSYILYEIECLLLFKNKKNNPESNVMFGLLTNLQFILIIPQLLISILFALLIIDMQSKFNSLDEEKFIYLVIKYVLLVIVV